MSTLPPLASVENLADWIGEAIEDGSADAKRAEGVLRVASRLARREANTSWVDGSNVLLESLPGEVTDIVCQAAARSYLNPEHLEQRRIDDAYAAGKVKEAGVYLTDSEKAVLREYASSAFGGLGVISTTRDDYPPDSLNDYEDSERILPPYY